MKDHNIDVFDPNKAILFRNWTNESFSWPWGGQPYTFQPGETRYFPEGLAHHFAKHLTDHALLKDGKDVDDQTRIELYARALMEGESVISHSDMGLKVELMNQEIEAEKPVEEVKVTDEQALLEKRRAAMAHARETRLAKLAAEKAQQ